MSAGPASFAASLDLVHRAGEQCDLRAALGEADPQAPSEPGGCTDDDDPRTAHPNRPNRKWAVGVASGKAPLSPADR